MLVIFFVEFYLINFTGVGYRVFNQPLSSQITIIPGDFIGVYVLIISNIEKKRLGKPFMTQNQNIHIKNHNKSKETALLLLVFIYMLNIENILIY